MTETNTKAPLLSQKMYDALKFIAQILLPAVGALYYSLAGLWNLTNADQVVGTITVVDAFLGVLLGISTKTYNSSGAAFEGHISIINKPDGGQTYALELDNPPETLIGKDKVTFTVGTPFDPDR